MFANRQNCGVRWISTAVLLSIQQTLSTYPVMDLELFVEGIHPEKRPGLYWSWVELGKLFTRRANAPLNTIRCTYTLVVYLQRLQSKGGFIGMSRKLRGHRCGRRWRVWVEWWNIPVRRYSAIGTRTAQPFHWLFYRRPWGRRQSGNVAGSCASRDRDRCCCHG